MQIVICPLRKSMVGNDEVCDKEGCAWYDEENRQCAILTIARKETK